MPFHPQTKKKKKHQKNKQKNKNHHFFGFLVDRNGITIEIHLWKHLPYFKSSGKKVCFVRLMPAMWKLPCGFHGLAIDISQGYRPAMGPGVFSVEAVLTHSANIIHSYLSLVLWACCKISKITSPHQRHAWERAWMFLQNVESRRKGFILIPGDSDSVADRSERASVFSLDLNIRHKNCCHNVKA